MKCGTSALYRALVEHPDVAGPREKELDFFIEEGNWARGVTWYESHFRAGTRVWCEASPTYTTAPYFAGVPERVAAILPDARLIYVVRDPVDRIISHYLHCVAAHQERRPFGEVIGRLHLEKEDIEAGPQTSFVADRFPDLLPHQRFHAYLARSMYMYQATRWLEHFDRSDILVLTQAQLLREPEALRTVGDFMGIDLQDAAPERRHVTADKRRMSNIGNALRDSRAGRRLRRSVLRDALIRVARPILYTRLPDVSVSNDEREYILSLLKEDADAFAGAFGVDVMNRTRG